MSLYFLAGLALAALFIWTVGAYSFWRISRSQKARAPRREVQPAFRLAEQWMAESQKKMEQFIQAVEQPLGSAQNELLELRLEAGRLPQGVKSLKLVRESLESSFKPAGLDQGLAAVVGIYLDPGDFRAEEPSVVFWKTSMGEMPCLEVEKEGVLSEDRMKAALARIHRAPAGGGFLYFPNSAHYLACLRNPQWMEGLKSSHLMVVDSEGLTALLIALRLSKDTDQVLRAFQEGVDSTRALTGQSEKMGEALSRFSVHALKARTVMEGNPPGDLKA